MTQATAGVHVFAARMNEHSPSNPLTLCRFETCWPFCMSARTSFAINRRLGGARPMLCVLCSLLNATVFVRFIDSQS